MTPSVSIVVPTRDRPLALARCLAAIERLDHPAERLEVVVVDDGSSLGLLPPPAQLCVRVLRVAGAARERHEMRAREQPRVT